MINVAEVHVVVRDSLGETRRNYRCNHTAVYPGMGSYK